jgi:hypothetical protein
MKESIMNWFSNTITYFKGVDNLYQKVVLTVMAIALVILCFELGNVVDALHKIARNLPDTFDGYINGSISID